VTDDDDIGDLGPLYEAFKNLKHHSPEFEVWNHLYSGLDQARWEMNELPPDYREALESLAKVKAHKFHSLVLSSKELAARQPNLGAPFATTMAWFDHAVEIEFAEEGIRRSVNALTRYRRLQPRTTRRPVPDAAKRHLHEVVETFLFGFDAACIALCRATLEQLLRDALLTAKVYTEPQLRRERPTAGALLENARRQRVLVSSLAAAENLVKRGDTVMHRAIYSERILEQQALDSIGNLVEVFVELLGEPGGTSLVVV